MKRFLRPEKASYGYFRIRVQLFALAQAGVLLAALGFSAAPAEARTLRVVALGDSLTAGFGLPPGEAFPDVLGTRPEGQGYDVEVANAGVSGETAADGLARYDWSVPEGTDALIVELGANDMLRGLDPGSRRGRAGADSRARAKRRHVAIAADGHARGAQSGRRLSAAIRRDLSRSRPALRRRALSVLSRRRGGRPKLNQTRRIAPDARGRRRRSSPRFCRRSKASWPKSGHRAAGKSGEGAAALLRGGATLL